MGNVLQDIVYESVNRNWRDSKLVRLDFEKRLREEGGLLNLARYALGYVLGMNGRNFECGLLELEKQRKVEVVFEGYDPFDKVRLVRRVD